MNSGSKYDWFFLDSLQENDFRKSRESVHLIIQSIAAVGRTYGSVDEQEDDSSAKLSWVPGLWRIAGGWIHAARDFRSSLSLDDNQIYLVDPKLVTLDQYAVENQSYHELMIWLEQQIISLELSTSKLSTDRPYELPAYADDQKRSFTTEDFHASKVLGGHFHDAFILFQEIKSNYEHTSEICIYPHHFDMETKIILKKTDELATDTFVRIGFSPGDTVLQAPYFYINSWPNITGEKLPKAPGEGHWIERDWIGLMLDFRTIYGKENQQEILYRFLEEGLISFKSLLLD